VPDHGAPERPALAQPAGFPALDRNGDGHLSRVEALAVETYEGRVQLSGFVPLPDMASRAGRVTAGVNGVRSVHNNITVK
jgi:osmotically-inducible protein OsmY